MDTIEKIKKCIEDTEIRNASKYDIKGTEIVDILKARDPWAAWFLHSSTVGLWDTGPQKKTPGRIFSDDPTPRKEGESR